MDSFSANSDNNGAMEWQFHYFKDQGVDFPAGKKNCKKEDFRKIVQEDIFAPLSRETDTIIHPNAELRRVHYNRQLKLVKMLFPCV